MIVYTCTIGFGPEYRRELFVEEVQANKTRRSSNNYTNLHVPYTKRKTFAHRLISVVGPRMWNKLPTKIRLNTIVGGLKRDL